MAAFLTKKPVDVVVPLPGGKKVVQDPPERPPPPIVGKVTHHTVELYWTDALDKANTVKKGDSRTRVCVQEQDKHGDWGNVYTGYAKGHTQPGLEPKTRYTFRIRFMNNAGNSEWSPNTDVITTKEPMTSEHLHKAILIQDLVKIDAILDGKDPVNIDATDKYGFSPLMQCAQKGFMDCLDTLIRHGADVNFQNDNGKTALMLAAFNSRTSIVKELRHHGARYDLVDKGGSTALHWAVDNKGAEVIQWMIKDGCPINVTDHAGWTPLLRNSAVAGSPDVAALLIEQGAQLNTRDRDGKTALMIAVINNHQELCKTLINAKCDLFVQNEYGKNAYEMAIASERRRIQQFMEDYAETHNINLSPHHFKKK